MPSVPPHAKMLAFKALHYKCQILLTSSPGGEEQDSLSPGTLQSHSLAKPGTAGLFLHHILELVVSYTEATVAPLAQYDP